MSRLFNDLNNPGVDRVVAAETRGLREELEYEQMKAQAYRDVAIEAEVRLRLLDAGAEPQRHLRAV